MKTYHQLRALQKPGAARARVAAIEAIQNGGARLRFAGGGTSQKFYRLPPGEAFAAGERVKLEYICGTYVVAGKV